MVKIILLFVTTFVFVFLKSFQQRNVIFENFSLVVPTSMLLAAAEVYIIHSVANTFQYIGAVLAMGFGGGAGCITAMKIHRRLTNNE